MKTYIGIDNGVSGSVGVIYGSGEIEFYKTPVRTEQSYTKKKQNITRVDYEELISLIGSVIMNSGDDAKNVKCFLERPFANPTGFKATMSAMRSLEATLIALEFFPIPYEYCDSKQWQKELLPQGIKGTALLKKASADIGCRLFPSIADDIIKQHDADGILIAEWARRNNL